jgi:hypothetical protein
VRWLRALVPYALILAIGGPIALALRTYYAERAAVAALTWAHPDVWVLAGAGLLLAWVGFHLARGRGATMAFSRVGELRRAGGGFRSYLVGAPMALRIVALGALIVALARPQTYRTDHLRGGLGRHHDRPRPVEVDGGDRPAARAADQGSARRRAAGGAAVRRRTKGDRVGLVVFAQQAMLQCPLTHDMHDASIRWWPTSRSATSPSSAPRSATASAWAWPTCASRTRSRRSSSSCRTATTTSRPR